MPISRAVPEHAGILTQIALTAKRYWDYPESWIARWTPLLTISEGYIAGNDVYELVLDGEVLGFYALAGDGAALELDHLWLLPEAIGKGLGRALFEHAAARARDRGASQLEILADPNAQGFYERMGARKIGERVTEILGQPRRLPILRLDLG